MSFTSEVREELARVDPACPYCELSTLAALARVCGTLARSGRGWRLQLATETGAVARMALGISHRKLGLRTEFTVRRSVLHKVRNYLIALPEQPRLDKALVVLGVLGRDGGIVEGVAPHLVRRACCRDAYVRAALVAGGFVADPRGDFHLEVAVSGPRYAAELAGLMGDLGARARVSERRGAQVVYVKSASQIRELLDRLGATGSVRGIDEARAVKSTKNYVNRRVNAELANQARSTGAASRQLELVARARALGLEGSMPPAVADFCDLREAHPEMSLRELGAACEPPLSKSALYHRLLRLERMVSDASRKGVGEDAEASEEVVKSASGK